MLSIGVVDRGMIMKGKRRNLGDPDSCQKKGYFFGYSLFNLKKKDGENDYQEVGLIRSRGGAG